MRAPYTVYSENFRAADALVSRFCYARLDIAAWQTPNAASSCGGTHVDTKPIALADLATLLTPLSLRYMLHRSVAEFAGVFGAAAGNIDILRLRIAARHAARSEEIPQNSTAGSTALIRMPLGLSTDIMAAIMMVPAVDANSNTVFRITVRDCKPLLHMLYHEEEKEQNEEDSDHPEEDEESD